MVIRRSHKPIFNFRKIKISISFQIQLCLAFIDTCICDTLALLHLISYSIMLMSQNFVNGYALNPIIFITVTHSDM